MARGAPLVAVALLVLNDHVLKALAPGFLTGKISDFAGLFFFPLFLADLVTLARRLARAPAGGESRVLLVACVATAVVFASVKTLGVAHDAYAVGLGALQWPFHALLELVRHRALPSLHRVGLVMDATDLAALVSVVAAHRYAVSFEVLAGPSSSPTRPCRADL